MKGICNKEIRQSEIIDMFYAIKNFGNVKRERDCLEITAEWSM
jgi:hypothetical protein